MAGMTITQATRIHHFGHVCEGSWGQRRCMVCGVETCTHHRWGLTGCMKPKGHDGSHFNGHGTGVSPWADVDGMFVDSQEDWEKLLALFATPAQSAN